MHNAVVVLGYLLGRLLSMPTFMWPLVLLVANEMVIVLRERLWDKLLRTYGSTLGRSVLRRHLHSCLLWMPSHHLNF